MNIHGVKEGLGISLETSQKQEMQEHSVAF